MQQQKNPENLYVILITIFTISQYLLSDFLLYMAPGKGRKWPSINLPGIVGWLYGCYTPPGVTAIRYGDDQMKFLKKLGCHPEREMPVNVSGNKPDLTIMLRQKIFLAELTTYGRYGFFMDGTYLTKWKKPK